MIQKPPSFQFYADKWLTGTMTLTLAARGAYITLLAYQWEHGSVPGDAPADLAKVLGVSEESAIEMWGMVSTKFTHSSSGLWVNKRLESERRKQRVFRKLQAQKGLRGANARWQRPSNGHSRKMAGASSGQWPNDGSSSSSSSPVPPSTEGGDLSVTDFDRFWAAYPRKVGKDDARKAWRVRRPDAALVARILAAVEVQRGQEQWQRENGRFVPHPATWLRQGRWQDGLEGGGPEPESEPLVDVPAAVQALAVDVHHKWAKRGWSVAPDTLVAALETRCESAGLPVDAAVLRSALRLAQAGLPEPPEAQEAKG